MSIFPTIKKSITHGEINGFCDPRFERVAEEFERNFQQRGEGDISTEEADTQQEENRTIAPTHQ